MYKNVNCGIHAPKDLVGKRIGLSAYQNTLGVRAKGDLTHFYGVPRETVTWVTPGKEVIDVKLPADVKIETRNSMAEIEEEFVKGSIQAMFVSRLPKPVREGHPSLARLFDDPQAEEERYLKKKATFPSCMCWRSKESLHKSARICPRLSMTSSSRREARAMQRWIDPNWSMMMWGRRELERQNQLCDFDPWRNGLEANRKNLERFSLYSHEQGLTRRRLAAAELFAAIN